MSDKYYESSKQEGYYGSKEDYYDADGNCYNFICNSVYKNKGLESKDIKLSLTNEKRAKLEKDIKEYFTSRTNKQLDDKDFGIFLDFFVEKVMPEIYDEGIVDAYIYVIEKIESLLEIRK